MKLLHTGDWHVGKTLRGRDRTAEHQAVLDEVAAVADREGVDLVLVVGDLFDTAAPSAEAERVVYRSLLALSDRGQRPVVVVGGNHDNPRRLAAVRPLLDLGTVHVQPELVAPDRGGVIELLAGGERVRVALLPFLSQRHVVRADDLMGLDADQHRGRYAERVRQIVAALTASFSADAVNVVAAHLMVAGGTAGGGERSAHTIFDYAVPATAFPASATYVALGHLHRPQALPAPCPVRYAGSPLALDFGETTGKSVTVVEASAGRPATIREIPLTAGRALRTLRGTLPELVEQAGATGDDHLRIVVREPGRVGLAEEVRDLFPHAVDVVVERPDVAGSPAGGALPERGGRDPLELFAAFLDERGDEDPRLTALFAELLDEVTTGEEVAAGDGRPSAAGGARVEEGADAP